ncbi:MAG: hypothetical protein AB1742_01715 [bacterium]
MKKRAAIPAALALLAALTGCGGGGGGGGPSPPPPDTTGPTITFTYPAESQVFYVSALPAYVETAYSDTGSGVNVQTLSVTFTLNQRTADLTPAFPTDPVNNASVSRTTAPDPLDRTTASFFSGALSGSPSKSYTVGIPPTPDECDFRVNASSRTAYVFCPSDTFAKLSAIDDAAGSVKEISPGFPVNSMDAAPAEGKYYLARSDAPQVAVFNASNDTLATQVNVSATPEEVSYSPQERRLYVSFASLNRVDVIDCVTDTLAGSFDVNYPLSLVRASPSGTGFFALARRFGRFWYEAYGADGSLSAESELADSQQSDVVPWKPAGNPAGYLFYSDAANDRLIVLDLQTLGVSYVSVAAPKELFADETAGKIYAAALDGNNVTTVNARTAAVESVFSSPVPVVTGEVLEGDIILLENIWDIAGEETGTFTARIYDGKSNAGTAVRNITIRLEVNPPVGPPSRWSLPQRASPHRRSIARLYAPAFASPSIPRRL